MELSKVKLSEVYKFLSENNISLMLGGANVHLHKLQEWFKDYYENENSAYFDNWILNLFGDMSFINTLLFRNIEDIKDTEKWNDTLKNQCVSFLQSQLNSVCFVHEYELQKLYESILLTYNPIENYSMTESGTDNTVRTVESTGNDTTANNITVTDNLGQTKTTSTNNERNNTTDNLGNTSTTEETTKEHPAKTITKELKSSPYDTSSYFNKEYETDTETYSNKDEEQKTTTTNSVVNTSNNERNNSSEVTTDSTTNSSKTETSNSSEFANNENNNTTTTHNFTRSGNIGVTTTQQMLISEREVAVFSLFQHFWELFVKDNMILLDDSADWNDCIFG